MRKTAYVFTTVISLILGLCLIAAIALLPNRLIFKGAEKYSFFTGDTSKRCCEIAVSGERAALTRVTLSEVCGESATYPSLDIDEFLQNLNGEVLFCEELSDSVNYYCKADLPYSVTLYGETVNLHICVKEGGTTVASPIIFGGY